MFRLIGISHVEDCSAQFLAFPNKCLAWGDSPIFASVEEVALTTSTVSADSTVSISRAARPSARKKIRKGPWKNQANIAPTLEFEEDGL